MTAIDITHAGKALQAIAEIEAFNNQLSLVSYHNPDRSEATNLAQRAIELRFPEKEFRYWKQILSYSKMYEERDRLMKRYRSLRKFAELPMLQS